MMARHCEGCGLKMTPYLPRTRSASGESLLCVECHQLDGWGHHASRGVPIRHFAHQPVEGDDTIWHCPWCGSGQIIARSDGTVQCNFCSRVFTVSLQPEHAEMPQTVDGQAVVPLEDESPEDELADASKIGDAETVGEGLDTAEELAEEPDEPDVVEESTDDDPGVTPRDTDSEDEESEDDEEESENPFTKKKSYLVLGGALDEDAFVRHLAMKHTTDPGRTLRALRRSRR